MRSIGKKQANRIWLMHWAQDFNFNLLRYTNGALERLVAKYKLSEGQGVVFTSRGWKRLRVVAWLNGHAVVLIPSTFGMALVDLVRWAQGLGTYEEVHDSFDMYLAKVA